MLFFLIEEYGPPFSGAAIFEMSEHIKVEFDVSDKHWTVVKLQDKISGYEITSMDSNDFYYDNEEDDYEEEEDY